MTPEVYKHQPEPGTIRYWVGGFIRITVDELRRADHDMDKAVEAKLDPVGFVVAEVEEE